MRSSAVAWLLGALEDSNSYRSTSKGVGAGGRGKGREWAGERREEGEGRREMQYYFHYLPEGLMIWLQQRSPNF